MIDVIAESFPISATLGLIALISAELIGITFGILCAQFRDRWPDYLLLILAILGIALPSMILGPVLRYWFGVKLKWLPTTGWGSPQQIVLPAIVTGLSIVAGQTRGMRASMLSVISEDYITAARAKGMHPAMVVLRHELKNSLVPVLTNMGVSIAGILMGSFVVEQVFRIPGLGKYFVDSVTSLDYPLIMGLSIFYGFLLVSMNLLVDVLYGVVDPRIRAK